MFAFLVSFHRALRLVAVLGLISSNMPLALRAAKAVESRVFTVAAADAAETLAAFGEQARTPVVYMVDEVRGVRTNAVRGSRTPLAALKEMVAGTALVADQNSQTGALIVRRRSAESASGDADRPDAGGKTGSAAPRRSADASDIVALDPFTVVSSDEGYLHSTSSVATRTNRPTIEIPQTISVVTAEFLSDTASINPEDAIAYVGNTFVRDRFAEPGTTIMRGFERDGEVYVDGFRDATYRRDAAAYDRMEVVKGPPSAVQGRSGSSGLINWVVKKPTLGKDFAATKFTFGGFEEELYRGVVDVNRKLWSKGSDAIGARAVAIYQRGDSWIDLLPDNKKALYPSVRWKRGDTEFNFFGGALESAGPSREIGVGPGFLAKSYRDKFTHPNLGGSANDPVSALDIEYGANPVGPDSVRNDRVAHGVVSVSHKLNEIFHARQAYQFLTASSDQVFFVPTANVNQVTFSYLGTPGVWVPVARGARENAEHRHSLQGDLVADLPIGKSIRSVTLAGYEWWDSINRANNYALAVLPEFLRVNLAAPFRSDDAYWQRRITAINPSSLTRRKIESLGYYVQQELELFNRVLVQGAWRHDAQELSTRNIMTENLVEIEDDTDSVRFGGTVFMNSDRSLALYGVYSDQKNPRQERNEWSGLNPGDPRIDDRLIWDPAMELIEFGLKGEFLERRLSVMLARFAMKKTGNLNTYSNIPTDSQGEPVFANRASIADSTNEGWEISLVGNVTRAISFTANFSLNDSNEIRVFGAETINQRIHRVPDYDGRLFAKWDLRNGRRNGFSVRGGVHTYADFEGTFNGIRTSLKTPFTQFNAGLNYKLGKYNIDLFVRNLTNEPIILFRGADPRGVRLSVDAKW